MANPEKRPSHVHNFKIFFKLNIEKIEDSFGIKQKKDAKKLLDCIYSYLNTLTLEKDLSTERPELQLFLKQYFDKRLIHYRHPYEAVYTNNTKVKAPFKDS